MRFTASIPHFLYRQKSTYSVSVSRSMSLGAHARCIEQALHISFTGFWPFFTLFREVCTRETASSVRYVENYVVWNYVIQNKFQ